MRDISELKDNYVGILCKTKEESHRITNLLNRCCMFEDYASNENYDNGIVYTNRGFCYLDFYKDRGFIIYNASEFLDDESTENKFFWGTPNKYGSWVRAGDSDKPSQYYSFFTVDLHSISDISTNFQNGWWMYVGPLPNHLNYVPKQPEFIEVSVKYLVDNPPKYVIIRGVKKEYLSMSFYKDKSVSLTYYSGVENFNITDKVKVIYE